MPAINLLPQEIKPKGAVLALSKKLKSVATLSLIIFLVALGTVIASLVVLSQRKESFEKSQGRLKEEIRQLESSEQKMILLKDRAKKIETILSQANAGEELAALNEISGLLASGMSITDANIKEDVLEATLVSSDLTTMTAFLKNVNILQDLKNINLLSFRFEPEIGYTLEISVIK